MALNKKRSFDSMSNIKNSMICETIKSMEQGEFQCFCLDLLPIHDSKYKGLKRFGHTAEGKTRKGTPDMLLTLEEASEIKLTGGRDSATQVLKILKAISKDTRKFTEEQEDYLKIIIQKIIEGALPKQTTKILLQELNNELKQTISPLKILAVLQKNVAPELLKEHLSESAAQTSGPREVILSEYLIGE